MTETSEEQLPGEVAEALDVLAPKANVIVPELALEVVKTDKPHYRCRKLIIPKSLAQDEWQKKTFHLGKLAGLVLWYHANPELRPLFGHEDCGERHKDCPYELQYDFWSQQAMTYTGFVALLNAYNSKAANYNANQCRQQVRDNPQDAAAIGVDYACQTFLRHGDRKLSTILTTHKIASLWPELGIVHNEWFYHFTERWDSIGPPGEEPTAESE